MSVPEPADVGRREPGPRGLADNLDDLLAAVDRWRARPAVAVTAAVACVVLAAAVWWLGRPPATRSAEELIPLVSVVPATADSGRGPAGESGPAPAGPAGTGPAPPAGDDGAPAEIVVHVAGAVAQPGIHRLPPGSRVADALIAAGGPAADADLDRLNLAATLVDGSQIRVPAVGEEDIAGPAPTIGPGSAGGGEGSPPPAPVDLNAADAPTLDTLPGVGPATAAAIVEWRTANGGFRVVEDLLAVPGIGPAKFEALADLVVVG